MVLLNLSKKNLLKIPNNLRNNITKLVLSDNNITKIENLPQRIMYLYLYSNNISKIENLSQHITYLDLQKNNQISKIENLPLTIRRFLYK